MNILKKLKGLLYVVAVLWALFVYFTFQPAINIHSIGFYFFLFVAIVPFFVLGYNLKNGVFSTNNKRISIILILFVVFFLIFSSIGTPYLGGLNSYMRRISIPNSSSISDMDLFNENQVQIIDRQVSTSLADRVFGEMGSQIVSQYQISDNYAQCVVNGRMYRITPVEYGGVIKWLSTKSDGTPGYISVDVNDGTTIFHKVEEGLKVTQNSLLLTNLNLKLRLKYPTKIFGLTKFEVDDNWNPYWVTEVVTYSFVSKAEDVEGIIVTNPINGESNYYSLNEIPSWVDNVYNPSLICDQYNVYSKYKNGLFNFAQKGVTSTTDDYAYLQKDGHLWIYTGITSIGNDESNVGYIYVDLQDKDVIYVESAGAEEYSAKASAEGALQEKRYTAVFPTMVNVEGEETYFMGLKDNAGLIKAYAFVSYKNYQKVGVGATIQEAIKNYTGKNVVTNAATDEKEIVVANIQNAVVDGYTIYFIQTTENEFYSCSIEISSKLPFISIGDTLEVIIAEDQIISVN